MKAGTTTTGTAATPSAGTDIDKLFTRQLLKASARLTAIALAVYVVHTLGWVPAVGDSVKTYDGQTLVGLVSLVIGSAVASFGAFLDRTAIAQGGCFIHI